MWLENWMVRPCQRVTDRIWLLWLFRHFIKLESNILKCRKSHPHTSKYQFILPRLWQNWRSVVTWLIKTTLLKPGIIYNLETALSAQSDGSKYRPKDSVFFKQLSYFTPIPRETDKYRSLISPWQKLVFICVEILAV